MTPHTTASPDDSYEALSTALTAAKLRVVQLGGWVAFAKARDGIATPKPQRKPRVTRKTQAQNGAGAGEPELYPHSHNDGASA